MYFKRYHRARGSEGTVETIGSDGDRTPCTVIHRARGAGAFPLALAYARYLNCTNRTDTDACGRCPSCLKYDELAHPDLHFVFPIVAKKEKKERGLR